MLGRTVAGQSILGNALKCVSASSQYCSRTTPSVAANNITVAFWLYINILPTGGNHADLFHIGDINPHNGYEVYLNSSGNIVADLTFVANCNAGTSFATGAWHHVVMVRDSGTIKFYIDGASSGTTTGSAWNTIGGGDKFTIGARYNGGTYQQFADVTIDDLRYYERAISSAEATALYNFGVSINNGDISNANLIVQWKLDETGGTTASDSSGNGNSGTTSGSPTFVTGQVQVSNVPARTNVGTARTAAAARTLAS